MSWMPIFRLCTIAFSNLQTVAKLRIRLFGHKESNHGLANAWPRRSKAQWRVDGASPRSLLGLWQMFGLRPFLLCGLFVRVCSISRGMERLTRPICSTSDRIRFTSPSFWIALFPIPIPRWTSHAWMSFLHHHPCGTGGDPDVAHGIFLLCTWTFGCIFEADSPGGICIHPIARPNESCRASTRTPRAFPCGCTAFLHGMEASKATLRMRKGRSAPPWPQVSRRRSTFPRCSCTNRVSRHTRTQART